MPVFSEGTSKPLKELYRKKRGDFFYKKNDKQSNADFPWIFLLRVLCVSCRGEFENTIFDPLKRNKYATLFLFWPLIDLPTYLVLPT
jgi:hypothetical protein